MADVSHQHRFKQLPPSYVPTHRERAQSSTMVRLSASNEPNPIRLHISRKYWRASFMAASMAFEPSYFVSIWFLGGSQRVPTGTDNKCLGHNGPSRLYKGCCQALCTRAAEE